MSRISRDSLLSLEAYARERAQFRARVMEHKGERSVRIGEHVTLMFEDELTMRYQIQEMLRAERIFEEAGIQEELDAYDPLVPDGQNWKATMMLEYPDVTQRQQMLAKLRGIEDRVWVRIGECPRVYAIADEDLERENAEKTSSVHFLRFELDAGIVGAMKKGARLSVGIDHPQYTATVEDVPAAVRQSLANDLT
jgi:uncharacterized protein DUF3501